MPQYAASRENNVSFAISRSLDRSKFALADPSDAGFSGAKAIDDGNLLTLMAVSGERDARLPC
jgi:hypothetical protein